MGLKAFYVEIEYALKSTCSNDVAWHIKIVKVTELHKMCFFYLKAYTRDNDKSFNETLLSIEYELVT